MSRNRYCVSLHFNMADRDKLRQLVEFWNPPAGFKPDQWILRFAFDQLVTATRQMIEGKEKKGDVVTKVVGEPGPDNSAPAAKADTAGADTTTVDDTVRGEGDGSSEVVPNTPPVVDADAGRDIPQGV